MEIDSGSSSTSRIRNSQSAAAKAEREAADRITAARKRVADAEMEAQKQLEVQRDSFEKRADVERTRSANAIEQQRHQGYEQIRDIRRQQEAEEHRVRRTAEKQIDARKNHYDQTLAETESRGARNLRELETKQHARAEFQRKEGDAQIEQMKQDQFALKEALHANQVDTHEQLRQHAQTERVKLEEKTRTAIQGSQEHYEDLYQKTLKGQQNAMADLGWKANRQVEAIRESSAHRLDAYSSRQRDPFYKLVSIGGNLQETDEQFVFKAQIPEHEQSRVSIAIRGNELVVSGQRRNEESLEIGPGRKQRTSSFQSYSESFPLDWPVNPANMTREFDGDTLIVRIPKRTTYEPPAQKRTADRTVAERPNFPKNLPNEKALAALSEQREQDPVGSVPPSKRGKGYDTLA